MKLVNLALLTTAMGATSAMAQTAPSTADDKQAREDETQVITVTANKRVERINDVAMGVSAKTGKELSSRQLLDLQDLQTQIPGLAVTVGSSAGTKRVIIRGINTDGSGATVGSTVDDIPLTFSNSLTFGSGFASDFEPFDLSRVEVLKGPQGTLYGATAQGGLIKYVTQVPRFNDLRGGFEVTGSKLPGGDLGSAARVYVNVPLSDTLAFRASGYYTDQPGWIDNKLAQQEDVNSLRRYGGRFSLLFQPNERLSVRLSAVSQQTERGGFDSVEMYGLADPSKPPFTLVDGLNFNTYVAQPWTAKANVYSATVKYDAGPVSIESITSRVSTDNKYTADLPVYKSIFETFFGIPNTALVSYFNSPLRKFNQEIRVSSNTNEPNAGLHWQIGSFYTNEKSTYESTYITTDISTFQPQSTFLSADGNVGLNLLTSKYEELAGYASVGYFISPKFDIEAGARVFHNRQTYSTFVSGALLVPAPTASGPVSSKETSTTFSIAPRYRIAPNMVAYARVASGYRPGGPNLAVPDPGAGEPASPPSSFTSDRTVNYEAGVKGAVLDNRLTFDVAAFVIDWTDIQVAGAYRRGGVSYSATVNGGKARSKGVEWSLTAKPLNWLSLGWLGAYTNATLSDDIPLLSGKAGVQLPYVPKLTQTATVDISTRINDRFTAFGGIGYTRTGTRLASFNPDPASASIALPAYDQWSAQGGIRFDKFTVQAYGKNLSNERGITGYSNGGVFFGSLPLYATASYIRPREIGLRVTADF
jgi:iron complex outermembrane recepter protein